MQEKTKNIIASILGFLTLIAVGLWWLNSHSAPVARACSFQILDVKEYTGTYDKEIENADRYFVYEGLIKNNSNKAEYLKAMIGKLYNNQKVYIWEGYTEMEQLIPPGTSMPFKVQIQVPTRHNTVVRKYFDESSSFQPDIYPWFTSCK